MRRVSSRPVDAARLTVAANQPEAELLASMLHNEGIECFLKPSDASAGVWGLGSSGAALEVWVSESDLERARELIDQPAESA